MSNGIANETPDQKVIYEQQCEYFRPLSGSDGMAATA
jgi:hypothetical protein